MGSSLSNRASAHLVKTILGIPSGPGALYGFSLANCLRPSVITERQPEMPDVNVSTFKLQPPVRILPRCKLQTATTRPLRGWFDATEL